VCNQVSRLELQQSHQQQMHTEAESDSSFYIYSIFNIIITLISVVLLVLHTLFGLFSPFMTSRYVSINFLCFTNFANMVRQSRTPRQMSLHIWSMVPIVLDSFSVSVFFINCFAHLLRFQMLTCRTPELLARCDKPIILVCTANIVTAIFIFVAVMAPQHVATDSRVKYILNLAVMVA